jgi:hypothetical protein
MTQDKNQLKDDDFNALLRILTPYIADIVDKNTKSWNDATPNNDQIDEFVGEILGATLELTEELADFDQEKIKKVDELAENGDFELAHRVLFNET